MKVSGFFFGFVFGAVITAATIEFGRLSSEPTRNEMWRDYQAYRKCIPRPGCMKADDYLDYYDLKWRFEGEQE